MREKVQKRAGRVGVITVALGCVLALGGIAEGKDGEIHRLPQPENWGATVTNLVVGAFEFQGNGSSNVQHNSFGSRLCVSGCPADLFTGLSLPSGAVVTKVVLDGCDFDPNENVSFDLFRISVIEGGQASTGTFSTSGNAGCAFTT